MEIKLKTVTDNYCSFEVSRMLSEKGFKMQNPLFGYNVKSETKPKEKQLYWAYDFIIPCPTHQLAIDWLRVNFNLWISVQVDKWEDGGMTYEYTINQINPIERYGFRFIDMEQSFRSPEAATEAALIRALLEIPIPLTEEWLKDCGFYEENGYWQLPMRTSYNYGFDYLDF